MVFSNKNVNNFKCDSIKIDNISINRVHVTKFLGVMIYSKLSWEDQLNTVCQKVSKSTAIILLTSGTAR